MAEFEIERVEVLSAEVKVRESIQERGQERRRALLPGG